MNQTIDEVIDTIFQIVDDELVRIDMTGHETLSKSIKTWLLVQHTDRNFFAAHTVQVIKRDLDNILNTEVYRDFILNVSTKVYSIIFAKNPEIIPQLQTWRCAVVQANCIGNKTALNTETFESIVPDQEMYADVINHNFWYMVYTIILEFMPRWYTYIKLSDLNTPVQDKQEN